MSATDAIEQFFREHAREAMRLALSMVGNTHDAEDVLQNAAASALRSADQLVQAPGRPWLARVIVNESRNFRRVRSRRRRLIEATPMPEPAAMQPGEQAALHELARRAFAELENLPRPEREAVALLYVSGLTVREAAEAAGVAPSTLAERAQGGLVRLRKRLGTEGMSIVLCLPLLPLNEPPQGWEAAADGWLATGSALRSAAPIATLGGVTAALWWKVAVVFVLVVSLVGAAWALWPDNPIDPDLARQAGESGERADRDRSDPDVTGSARIVQQEKAPSTARSVADHNALPEAETLAYSPARSDDVTSAPEESNAKSEEGMGEEENQAPLGRGEHLLVRTCGKQPEEWFVNLSISALAMSPDGLHLAAAEYWGDLLMLDAGSGKIIKRFEVHDQYPQLLSFHPDGRWLATYSSLRESGNLVKVWNWETGELVASYATDGECRILRFLTDGRLALGWDETLVFWLPTSGAEAPETTRHNLPGKLHDVSADGELIVCETGPGEAAVIQAEASRILWRVRYPKQMTVRYIVLSPDKLCLAATSNLPDRLLVWNSRGEQLVDRQVSTSSSQRPAFSEDGRYFVSIGSHETLVAWDATSWERSHVIRTFQQDALSLAVGPDARLAYTAGTCGTLRVWDIVTGEMVSGPDESGGHVSEIYKVRVSPDGRYIASAAADKSVKLWDFESGDVLFTVYPPAGGVSEPCLLKFSPEGECFYVAYYRDSSIFRYRTSDGELRQKIELSGDLWAVELSPDCRRAVVQFADGVDLSVVSLETSEAMQTLHTGGKDPGRPIWIADDLLLMVKNSGAIKVFDPAVSEPLHELNTCHNGAGIGFVHGNPVVVVATGSNREWEFVHYNMRTGLEVCRTAVDPGWDAWGTMYRMLVTPDRARIFCCILNVQTIVDAETGELLETYIGHDGQAIAADMHPSGKYFVTGGLDSKDVKIWRIP